jgi:hypothetical protein
VGAPARLPNKAGDGVNTDGRDAMPLARIARSGDLPAVDVPTVYDDAMRDRTRARAAAISALKDAPCRLNACVLRHDSRSTGDGARQWSVPRPRNHACFKHTSKRFMSRLNTSNGERQHATSP